MERLAKRRIPGRVPGRFQGYSWRVRLRLREGGRGVAQEGGAVELLLPAAAFAAAGSPPGMPCPFGPSRIVCRPYPGRSLSRHAGGCHSALCKTVWVPCQAVCRPCRTVEWRLQPTGFCFAVSMLQAWRLCCSGPCGSRVYASAGYSGNVFWRLQPVPPLGGDGVRLNLPAGLCPGSCRGNPRGFRIAQAIFPGARPPHRC